MDAFDSVNPSTITRITYTVLDMEQNAGKGAVIAEQKRVVIPNVTAASELLAVAPKGDNSGFWVFGHLAGSEDFVRIEVTADGVLASEVTFLPWGSTIPRDCDFCVVQSSLVFSRDYKKAAMSSVQGSFIDIYDFDACNGIFTTYLSFQNAGSGIASAFYGLAFSPSGRYLYYTGLQSDNNVFSYGIFRVDLEESPTLNFTRDLIALAPEIGQAFGTLQLGTDNKLYVATANDSLTVISNPDAPLLSDVGYNYRGIALPFGSSGQLGLPQRVPDSPGTPLIDPRIVISPPTACAGVPQVFSLIPAPAPGTTITWHMGNGATFVDNGFSYIYPQIGNFTVQAQYNDPNTCNASDIKELTEVLLITSCENEPECIPLLPNAFSPNNDGINDSWGPITASCVIRSYLLTVYNRWGDVVFQTNLLGQHWHPKEDTPEGVYVFNLALEHSQNNKQSRNGTVTLIR